MVPGLWLEPEVVGVDSPVAAELPPDAFFRRGGVRVADCGRYQLDLRHPAAVAHLDRVVDRLVCDLGAGYLKLDYNINIGPGTETDGAAAGVGLLGHNRALLRWLGRGAERGSVRAPGWPADRPRSSVWPEPRVVAGLMQFNDVSHDTASAGVRRGAGTGGAFLSRLSRPNLSATSQGRIVSAVSVLPTAVGSRSGPCIAVASPRMCE